MWNQQSTFAFSFFISNFDCLFVLGIFLSFVQMLTVYLFLVFYFNFHKTKTKTTNSKRSSVRKCSFLNFCLRINTRRKKNFLAKWLNCSKSNCIFVFLLSENRCENSHSVSCFLLFWFVLKSKMNQWLCHFSSEFWMEKKPKKNMINAAQLSLAQFIREKQKKNKISSIELDEEIFSI